MRFLWLVGSLVLNLAVGDVYLHFPPGANNRLEDTGDANGNRLYDTQNNARGGYNVNSRDYPSFMTGQLPAFDIPYYYEGSILPIQYSAQHECAGENTDCQIIIQYMCDPNLRDGFTTPMTQMSGGRSSFNQGVYNPEFNYQKEYGQHESYEYYRNCLMRTRNTGLYTADQDFSFTNKNFPGGAIRTRQNRNGNRRGYECAEERDYYPYWQPTPWIDIAVMTNNPARCAAYQAESENVKPRWYCSFTQDQLAAVEGREGWIPIDPLGCAGKGGVWTQGSARNLPPPECLPSIPTRDNHHGNTYDGYFPTYNWTIPATFLTATSGHCTIRIRYNITSSEFNTESPKSFGFDSDTGVGAPKNVANSAGLQPNNPANVDVWSRYGLNQSEVGSMFSQTLNEATRWYRSRGYVMIGGDQTNQAGINYRRPLVNPFGSLLDPYTPTNNGTLFFSLAFNSEQMGRTFQDRTHAFAIKARTPAMVATGSPIYNLGVRGKRGNIVQVYPAVEYCFIPDRLDIHEGSLIHIQWSGSNVNQQGNDRNNLVMQTNAVYQEAAPSTGFLMSSYGSTIFGDINRVFPQFINDTRYSFLGFSFADMQTLALSGVNKSYFDLGVRQITRAGLFNYIGTRNNAFSNRNQQATIVVRPAEYTPYVASLDAALQCPPTKGGAYVTQNSLLANGKVIPATVCVEDLGGGAFRVTPDYFGLPYSGTGNTLAPNLLTLTVPHDSLPLHDVVYTRVAVDGSGYSTQINLGSASSVMTVGSNRVSFALVGGGVYVVSDRLQQGAVAGIVVGIFVFVCICVAIYWKLRVQPHGGWKAWMKAKNYNVKSRGSADKPLVNGSGTNTPPQAETHTLTASPTVTIDCPPALPRPAPGMMAASTDAAPALPARAPGMMAVPALPPRGAAAV